MNKAARRAARRREAKQTLYVTDREPERSGGNYLPAVRSIAARSVPGTVAHIDVLHDDWCAIWDARPCNCEPEIRRRQDG